MKISDELVLHVCALARLKFEGDKLDRFKEQFEQIIKYVEKINELDLEDVEPTSHAVEQSNAFRSDEIKKSLNRDLVLANAPKAKGGFFVTPKVIEEQ